MVKGQSVLGNPSLEAPFSQVTLDCVRLAIKKNNQHKRNLVYLRTDILGDGGAMTSLVHL